MALYKRGATWWFQLKCGRRYQESAGRRLNTGSRHPAGTTTPGGGSLTRHSEASQPCRAVPHRRSRLAVAKEGGVGAEDLQRGVTGRRPFKTTFRRSVIEPTLRR